MNQARGHPSSRSVAALRQLFGARGAFWGYFHPKWCLSHLLWFLQPLGSQ